MIYLVKPNIPNETKEEKFKRIATARTRRILSDLRLLGNCSNTSVYSYTQGDVNKIFLSIDREIKRVKAMYNKPTVEFSLE